MCVQLGQRFSQPKVEDSSFVQTKSMLQTLGLEKYEKNFKKGLLTDATLPLLNDRWGGWGGGGLNGYGSKDGFGDVFGMGLGDGLGML